METREFERSGSLPQPLRSYLLWTVALTGLAIGIKLFNKLVLHLPNGYVYPFFPRTYMFVDFKCFRARFLDFHHLTFFLQDSAHEMTFTYPAPAALVYEFFYRLPKSLLSFLLITGCGVLTAAVGFSEALVRRGISRSQALLFVGFCMLCSWPLFVTFWVGNIEIVIGLLMGLGLYFFVKERYWPAAILISVAAAVKIFPFVFLALFLGKKLYKQMGVLVGLAAVIEVVALWMISGSIEVSRRGISDGFNYLDRFYILPYNRLATGIDHSLFGFMKAWINLFCVPHPSFPTMSVVLHVYVTAMAIAGILLYFRRIQYLPLLNRILCLSTLAVLITPLSIDYTLMHLYLPWGMMILLAIEAERSGRRIPGLKAAFACFLVLLCTLSEFIFRTSLFGGQIKTVALIVLLVVGLRYPFVSQEQPTSYAPA